MVEKEDMTRPAPDEPMVQVKTPALFMDIELVDLDAEAKFLESPTKADLGQTPIVAPLKMMIPS